MSHPNRAGAFVPTEKLSSYLLSLDHPIGHSKAFFFRSLGYDESNVALFVEGLLQIARDGEVGDTIETIYGVKYVISGNLDTPSGQTIQIRTIWIIEEGTTGLRFVTAYPSN